MNIWVPYTEVQLATRIALRDYTVHYEPIGNEGYAGYFRDRWAETTTTFINVEHDVVPWPGAIEKLWQCPSQWCAYGYHTNDMYADRTRTLFPYLGCVKFSAAFIQALPGVWDGVGTSYENLDRHIADIATAHGLAVHQHWPAVVNANPVLINNERA